MWLFKPNMRLSYKASKHYLLPEHGTIQAAKVLFKVLGPSMSSMDLGSLLDRYPGFPQAEQLMYPKDTCTQIAVLLRESNACYPEGMRSMTGLDVGDRKSVHGFLYVIYIPYLKLVDSFLQKQIWLFKPSMRLSYKASKNYLLAEHGTVQAAKVLFKILGPSISDTDLGSMLDRYPGFPQAEQLMYPKDTCTQIAVLLRESNACYPEGMRSMTGLEVGWLLRA